MRLTALPRPFTVAVVTDQTLDRALDTFRRAANEGAQAIELNLPPLFDATVADLERLIGASPLPVYTSCRRAPFMQVYGLSAETLPHWDDDERMERQIETAQTGAYAIDMELDAFDPHPAPPLGTPEAESFATSTGDPAEITDDLEAIEKQREIVSRAHEAGAEIICSCHTGRPQSLENLLGIANRAVERGADLLKIVTPCRDRGDLLTVLQASHEMAERLPIPFILVGAGRAGLMSRTIGVDFGSSWYLAQVERTPDGFQDQPLVGEIAAFAQAAPWRAR
jgi:hypothetical protein